MNVLTSVPTARACLENHQKSVVNTHYFDFYTILTILRNLNSVGHCTSHGYNVRLIMSHVMYILYSILLS